MAFLVIVLKKSSYFCSDNGKARPATRCNLLLYEPGNRSLCKCHFFLRFFAAAPAWPKYILVMVVFPLYMKQRNKKGKDIMLFVVVLETEQSRVVFGS